MTALKLDLGALERLEGQDRKRAQEALAAYEAMVRENPLLRYVPHAKQVPFHVARDPIKLFFGGNRSGKTTAGILDDLIQAVDRSWLPEHLVPYKRWEPPFYCRIICPDFTSTMEGVIFQKLREWTPRGALRGGKWDRAYDKQRRRLEFANGSWMDFMTFEQDLDKFGGAALHRVHYDEEPPQGIRSESQMRLLDFGGDELFTMTPLQGMSWMFDEFWEPFEKGQLQDASLVLVDMDDNPHLDEESKARILRGRSWEEVQARKQGRFVHFAGLIYGDFSRPAHVVPELEGVPDGVKVFVGIDPGTRHMAAVVWCYVDDEDRMVVFDELALRGHTVREVCHAIQLVNEKWRVRPEWYVIDPAARNVSHQTGRSDQMEYADHGVVTIAGQNAVTAGINRVKERLQRGALLVCANCTVTIDQFRKYRWSTPSRSDDDPKEKPVKRDDHALDALRYVCMSRPYAPAKDDPDGARLLGPLERAARDEMRGRTRLSRRLPKTEFGGVFA